MDCVACEKCRVWGKLQILGLGTAIKILLTPEKDLETMATESSKSQDGKHETGRKVKSPRKLLNRQEVVALINTLHQLATSVSFAASTEMLDAQQQKANQKNGAESNPTHFPIQVTCIITGIAIPIILFQLKLALYRKKVEEGEEEEEEDEEVEKEGES